MGSARKLPTLARSQSPFKEIASNVAARSSPFKERLPPRPCHFEIRLARIIRYRRRIERSPHQANDSGTAQDVLRRFPDLLIAGAHCHWGRAAKGASRSVWRASSFVR
jgi:hypothetical protein